MCFIFKVLFFPRLSFNSSTSPRLPLALFPIRNSRLPRAIDRPKVRRSRGVFGRNQWQFFHHYILFQAKIRKQLKKPKIPKADLFNEVACPHYLFEKNSFLQLLDVQSFPRHCIPILGLLDQHFFWLGGAMQLQNGTFPNLRVSPRMSRL